MRPSGNRWTCPPLAHFLEWLRVFRRLLLRRGGRGKADDFHIVLLRRARRGASGGDELLQQRFHLGDFLGHRRGEVFRFADVAGEIVELHGLRLIPAGGPAAGAGRGDVFPRTAAQRGHAVDGCAHGAFADRLVLALQERQQAEAVFASGLRERRAEHIGEGADEVGLIDGLAAHAAGLHDAGPAHDERHAMLVVVLHEDAALPVDATVGSLFAP